MNLKKKTAEMVILLSVLALDLFLFGFNLNNMEDKKQPDKNNIVSVSVINATANIINANNIQKSNLQPEIVYDGLTLDELTNKLNKSLNSTIAGKGNLIASYSLEKGVDPYMAEAIILQETGCKWDCSYLVKSCNNVGGQKGSGCGGYSYFPSLDEGIKAFIDNLYNNYVSLGLTTPEQINPKYAESTLWAVNVNSYIDIIKAQ